MHLTHPRYRTRQHWHVAIPWRGLECFRYPISRILVCLNKTMLSSRFLLSAFILLLFPLFTGTVYAQTDIVTAGGDASGNGSFSWSLGQIDASAFAGTSGSVQAGVQHGIQSTGPASVIAFRGGWQVYPNPFQENLTIRTAQPGVWTLSDVSGRLCSQGFMHNPYTRILLEPLPPGMYFLRLSSPGQPPFAIPLLRQ